jgi:GGDEF domain-containing protein
MSGNAAGTLIENGRSDAGDQSQDEFSLLWNNIIWNSSIKFFWKDKDLRYVGASDAFLKYFHLDSIDDIIGKRGEEMPWHLESDKYHRSEKRIVMEGKTYDVVICKCVIDGVIHNTATSKIPIYRDGEIVGLMGYVIDIDEAGKTFGIDTDSAELDEVTGIGNIYSLIGAVIDYSNQYKAMGKDFGLILLRNNNYKRILESYGKEVSNGLLEAMADEIEDVISNEGMAARTKDSYFAVLIQSKTREELTSLAERLCLRLEGITSVDGINVTVKTDHSMHMRSEPGMTDEGVYIGCLSDLGCI